MCVFPVPGYHRLALFEVLATHQFRDQQPIERRLRLELGVSRV